MASNGNFATLNPLIKSSTNTFSFGNCRITSSSGGWGSPLTHAVNSGKWYVEIYLVVSDTNGGRVAVVPTNSGKYNQGQQSGASVGDYAIEWKYDGDSNFIANNGSTTQSSVGSWSQGDVLAVAMNLDASPKTVQFYKNNSTIGSAENINTNAVGPFTVMIYGHNAGTWHINAGQDSTFGGSITAGNNADSNSIGDFKYSPVANHLALSSANLPISDDIDPAQTDDDYPSKQFFISQYAGNLTNRTITTEAQPDLIIIRSYDNPQNWYVVDSSRGITANKYLMTNSSNAEATFPQSNFTSVGATSVGISNGTWLNSTGQNLNMWMWKANGGTTASNTDGDITSTVQANTKAGFSIVTYTGNGNVAQSIGHGLSSAPQHILVKNRSQADSWAVYHHSLGNSAHYLLDTNSSYSTGSAYWGSFTPTSTIFKVGNDHKLNASGENYVAYCWHGVEGYSAFATYNANGNSDGTFIPLSFRPRMIWIRRYSGTDSTFVFDTARSPHNAMGNFMFLDTNDAQTGSNLIDVYSNGFKLRTTSASLNPSGTNILYCAWGDVPFKYNNTF